MTRSKVARARAEVIARESDRLTRSRLRLFGVVLICAKLALIPVVFDYDADLPFTVVKALTSHVMAYLLAGVLGGLFVLFGSSLFVRSWLHVPVAVFVVANIAATVFAADGLLALYGAHERMLGLGTIADYVVLYFAIVLIVRTRTEAIALAASLLAGSFVVLGYEVIQLAGRDPLAWAIDSSTRPFSTIGQANSLAEYLTVLAIGAAGVAIFSPTLPRRVRVLLAVFCVAALAGAIATQTRSTVIGILSGTASLVVLTWLGYPDRRARSFTVVGAAGTSFVLGLVLLITPLGSRVFGTIELSAGAEGDGGARLEGAADVRAALYRISVDMFRDRPILGYGPDNLLAALPNYRSDHEPFEVQDVANTSAHSWVAQVAVTSGSIGLAAFVAIPVVGLVLTLRRGFRPLAWTGLAMVGAFLGEGLTTINAVSTDQLFWFGAAAVAASTAHRPASTGSMISGRAPKPLTSQVDSRRWPVAFLSVALASMLAGATFNALGSSHAAKASSVARLQGRNQQAIDRAVQATQSDPMRSQYWETLGLAYVSSERFRDAVRAFEQASKLAPYDVRYEGDLARALGELAQRGDSAAGGQARSVAEHIVRTDPNHPMAQFTRAYVMQVTGNLPEALKSVERAIALDRLSPSGPTIHPEIYVTGVQVLTTLQRPSDAIVLARRALTIVPERTQQVPVRIELSRALAANGQLTEALTEIDSVLVVQPNHSGALQLRAQITAALGR